VLTERLTYPGLRAVAQLLCLHLVGVDIDEKGIVPEALEAACRCHRPTALYCAPTLHNPTAAVADESRRSAIATLARRYDIAVLEDDVPRLLMPDAAPPIATMAPERTYYILDTAKAVAAGLCVAYVVVPGPAFDGVSRSICATGWMTPPLMAEIAARWIRDGTALRIAEVKRTEAAARQRLARKVLPPDAYRGHPDSFLLWLELPEPWSAHDFVQTSRRHGVVVRPADTFGVGREPAPHAVRISLSATETREELEEGLQIITDVLAGSPEPELALV
jgi:DNA-binding transcriptional MocR family regulator